MSKRSIWLCILAALMLYCVGCGDDSSQDQDASDQPPPQAQQPAGQTVAVTTNQYETSKYDSERETLCDQIRQYPDVVDAQPGDTAINVDLYPSASDSDALGVARKLRAYLNKSLSGERSYIAYGQITLTREGSTDSLYSVATGQDFTSTAAEYQWDIIDQRQFAVGTGHVVQ